MRIPNNVFVKNDFGMRVRLLRFRKRLTQKQLAEMVGLSHATISAIEIGSRDLAREPSLRRKILSAL